MSSVWRKLRGKKADPPKEIKSVPSFDSGVAPNLFSISSADEDLLKNLDPTYDPLGISPQIARNLQDTLADISSASYKFFADFLESQDVDFLLTFINEVAKYQLTFKSTKQDMCINAIIPIDEQNIRKSSIPSTLNIEGIPSQVLPDLVSNIPQNVVVTPQSSPDEENNPSVSYKQTDNHCYEKNNADDCANLNVPKPQSVIKSSDENPEKIVTASQLFYKYIDTKCVQSVGVSDRVRNRVGAKLSSGIFCENLFSEANQEVTTILDSYYCKYLESQDFLKHEIDVLTSQNILLQDILQSEAAMPYFMEYMEQEGCQLLLEFWISVSNFRSHLRNSHDSLNPEQSQTDAMILYDKYFSLQARTPIGFSDDIRFLVEGNICQEGGPSFESFDVPLRMVVHIFQRDHLRNYLSSSLHVRLLRELINKVKVNSRDTRKRSGSVSTCSSDQSSSVNPPPAGAVSISQKNTLLAMESSGRGGKELKTLTMRIDSNQILDPDSIWRRKNFTRLSCGYVDELGRFESDIQPEPGKREESRISKTFRKIVKKEENKTKEELAYKVAEMIIKDVTNLTLREEYDYSTPTSPQSLMMSPVSLVAPPLEREVPTPVRSKSSGHLTMS